MADPGTAGSAFACLFAAVDIYKPFIFFLDEIYEKEVEKTVTPYIAPLIHEKCVALHPELSEWNARYDVAAAWFFAHYRKAYPDSELKFAPVEKKPGEKEDGLDTLNALFINNSIAMSQRCGNTIWEFDNYCRDKNGKLPKRNDHNIDNSRYLTKAAGIIAGVGIDKPLQSLRRKAKNTRSYLAGPEKKREGKLNIAAKIIKPYEYD